VPNSLGTPTAAPALGVDSGLSAPLKPKTAELSGACNVDDYNSAFAGACSVGDLSSLKSGSGSLLDNLKSNKPDFTTLAGMDNNLYSAYASNLWTEKFQNQLSTAADKTLATIFDEKGDAEKVAKGKQTGLDGATQALLSSHKNGESWSANGVNYYKTDAGALIERDKAGMHYIGPDGLRFDGSGKDGTITKNGETVVKKGDSYFKQYPDGQQVQIKEKGDIAAIEKIEGMVFEQRKHALEHLSPDRLATMAAKGAGNTTVQGTDGVQVFNVDRHGDVIAKSSNQHGAFVRFKEDGHTYRIKDGKVYTIGSDGKTETEVAADKLPHRLKVNADGSIAVGTVTISKDNQWTESTHHQHMENMTAKVIAATAKGPVVAEVVNGKESVKAPDHTYEYDPKASGGEFHVYKPDGTPDLSYNYASHDLHTDGIDWNDQGLHIGDDTIGNDGSLTERGLQIMDGDAQSSSADYAEDQAASANEDAEQAESDAGAEVADAESELGMGTIDYGDVAEVANEYASLQSLQGLNLNPSTRARLSTQIGQLARELPVVEAQANANALVASLTGVQDAALTKAVMANGGALSAADVIKRRWGTLPPLEIVGEAA
jgi:hypothetical protein